MFIILFCLEVARLNFFLCLHCQSTWLLGWVEFVINWNFIMWLVRKINLKKDLRWTSAHGASYAYYLDVHLHLHLCTLRILWKGQFLPLFALPPACKMLPNWVKQVQFTFCKYTYSCLSKIYTYFKLLILCFNIYISKQLKLNYVMCNDICLLFMFSSNETLPLINVVSMVANRL